MPKRDEKYMAARRQEILDATIRCVERLGLGRTSTTEICKEGKLSMGALYTHFKSRDEILAALALDVGQGAEDRLRFSTADEMFRVILGRIATIYDPELRPVLKLEVQLVAESFDVTTLRTLTDRIYPASLGYLEASFASMPWLAPGVTPSLAASLIESLTYGLIHRFATGTLRSESEELAAVAQVLEWISGKPAPSDKT